jgi:hypothetical protein
MDIIKKYAVWIGFTLVIVALALLWWLQPERQVRRAQKRLIAALESRDFAAFERMLADDYRDGWGHNKANVVSRSSEVFRQFLFLTIAHEEKSLVFNGGAWVVSEKITMKGTGGPLANYAMEEVAKLTQPFAISWRNNGGATKWVVTAVNQPELNIPSMLQ